jgi:hypothetical protein
MRQSVRFDEPTAMTGFLRTSSLSPTKVELPLPVPAPSGVPREVSEALFPAGRPEERVVRQSIRFDDGPAHDTRSLRPLPAELVPTAPFGPSGHADLAPPPEMPAAAPPASPWDAHPGPARALDLDASPAGSPYVDVLAAANASRAAPPLAPALSSPPLDQARIATPPADVVDPAAPVEARPTVGLAPVREDAEAWMVLARDRFERGDFTGSLECVEKVLAQNPEHEGARAYGQRNEATLTKMYESKLGDLTRAPRQLVPPDEVVWMSMHHRAGFLLSQIDGTLSFNDLIDVAGIRRLDAVRILATFVGNGVIG